jgi:hypothetical protein
MRFLSEDLLEVENEESSLGSKSLELDSLGVGSPLGEFRLEEGFFLDGKGDPPERAWEGCC